MATNIRSGIIQILQTTSATFLDSTTSVTVRDTRLRGVFYKFPVSITERAVIKGSEVDSSGNIRGTNIVITPHMGNSSEISPSADSFNFPDDGIKMYGPIKLSVSPSVTANHSWRTVGIFYG